MQEIQRSWTVVEAWTSCISQLSSHVAQEVSDKISCRLQFAGALSQFVCQSNFSYF